MLVCVLRLSPATPGWGVRCGCGCLCSDFRCAPSHLAGLLGCACWCARSPCTSPLLAWVCNVGVCAWTPVLAAPRHSWLGCWGVCVLVSAVRLYPATPGSGVRRGCVCLGSGFSCAPPLLAGVLGCVCADVCAPPVPRHSWLGCALWVCVLGPRFWLRPATPRWGLWCVGLLFSGTCSCAVVSFVLCALPGFAAHGGCCCLAPSLVPWLWPAACLSGVPRGPALVCRASSGSVSLSAPIGFPVAVVPFPNPAACGPGFTGWLRRARGGRPRTGLIVPAAGPLRGKGAGLAPRCTRSGPRDGVVPRGSLGLRALWCFACVDPVTDASGFPYRPSFDRGLGRCTGAVSCGRRHRPFQVRGRHTRVPCVCACACFLGRVGRAGLPGAVWCASLFPVAVPVALCPLGPLRARVALLVLFLCFVFFSSPLLCPPLLRRSVFSGPGCLGPWRLVVLPSPLFSFALFLPFPLRV